jgi:hypothetical protein
VFVDRVFESIFIEIKPANCNKIIIGSAYRPGSKHSGLSTTEQFSQFSDLFSNLCNELSSLNYPVYLAGDINLDVLLYNSNPKVTEYINLLFSFGFLQTVTRPTRISDYSATLIDHIISNVVSSCHETVILTSRISDHFPVVYFKKLDKPKVSPEFFESRNFSQQNINRFQTNLMNINWNDVYTEMDTQAAYNIFSSLFFNLYDLHFPLQRTNFNKNFHKLEGWMSSGILVS